ncbi:MAG: amidophosphoribosyltransferase [Bacteroidales bacterium]|jgi:amidophosphoribosyltransferase|nr:amidophosphoribosyltransferase [Bacteroidales bacterium]
MSGFFGCVSRKECVCDVFYGTDYHSHLGTKKAGMAFYNGESFIRVIHSIESAYFRNKFEPELDQFIGSNLGIGIISDMESQPITITSHLGRYSVVTVGRIDNLQEISDQLLDEKIHFAELSGSEINPTEVICILINKGETFKEGIENVYKTVKGSCSFLILTDNCIYAARDRFGRTPVIIGKDDFGYVLASESSSFTNLGYSYVRDIGPGEAVRISKDGVTTIIEPGSRKQICSFLWVYYGYPSAYYEGINVEDVRYRCGGAIARRDNFDVDFAAGIPDSGVAHAIGYSNAKRIHYKRPFVKYTPTWPRSFMPQNQTMRDLVAKMKLLPNEALTQKSKIVFLDDSIVRGTQLKDNVVKLRECGVEEVHIRIACPPLIYPCCFLNFSTSRSTFDLFARRVIRDLEGTSDLTEEILQPYTDPDSEKYKAMVKVMCQHLQLDSLQFQRLDDLIDAIGLPKEQLCTHCWDNSSYTE